MQVYLSWKKNKLRK